MTCIAWFISLFYNVIIAIASFYLFASFTRVLPWATCDNAWNNHATCHVIGTIPHSLRHYEMLALCIRTALTLSHLFLGNANLTIPLNETTSPAVEYYV